MATETALQRDITKYESSLSTEQRRISGTVYTPVHLVEFILDVAGYDSAKPIENIRLLDPSCGCGVFLAAAVHRLADRQKKLGVRLSTKVGRRKLLTAVESCLFGIDRDPTACRYSVEFVREALSMHIPPSAVLKGFFTSNVTTDDFLDGPPGDLFSPGDESKFDLVVGNPPYVSATRLTDKEKERLRQRYVSAHGRIDLYGLFFERAIEVLSPNGHLAFITPDKYLTSESARRLRKLLLKQSAVTTIARFKSHRVFSSAATVPCVTVLSCAGDRSKVVLMECVSPDHDSSGVTVKRRYTVPALDSTGAQWHLLEPKLDTLVEYLRAGHPTLDQVVTRISAGIATGRDGLFVVPEEVADRLEPELLYPAIRGQDIRPYSVNRSGRWVIVPYQNAQTGKPALVDIYDFPKTAKYLQSHRDELVSRHCVRTWGKAWYDIHDPWTMDIAAAVKVVLPDVANSNRFAFEPGGSVPLHSAYYMVPSSGIKGEALVAILNSTVLEFLVRLFAPVVKDGFSRYRKQFLKTLPIPKLNQRQTKSIVGAAQRRDFSLVDEYVSDLFNLSKSRRIFIDRWVRAVRRA